MNDAPKISQEMIRLYDEYTHLTLDRRGFMEKLTKLAGSGAAAAALVPILSNDYARAAMVMEDDSRLTIEQVEYPGAGGVTMKGYLARPGDAEGPLPAVVVIHENRGLNPHIEDVTRRMALEGFLALGVDFLSPAGGTPDDEDRGREMIGQLDRQATVANAVASVDWIRDHPMSNGKVGAIGFCWGGGLVNQLAVASDSLVAAVPYYGAQPDPGNVEMIQAQLMLHYAGLDDRINAGIADYETALKDAGVEYQVFVYEGANHAFNNDTNTARYDEAAANLAWSRTVAFLKEALS